MMLPKFRGWDRKNHIMYDFMMMCFNVNLKNVLYRNNLTDFDVDMYTGLKDDNGKEIYEGDIVRMHVVLLSPDDKVGYVEYHKKYGYSLIMNDRRCRQEYWANDNKAVYEVIGNIHTNSELLEAQHDTQSN